DTRPSRPIRHDGIALGRSRPARTVPEMDADRRHYDIHWNTVVAGDLISMATKKKQTSQVPLADPPGPPAPIGDWIEHRRDLDRLEAEIRINHPDLPLFDELQSL